MHRPALAALALCCSLTLAANAQAPVTAPSGPPAKIDPAKSIDGMLTGLEKELMPLVEAMPADKWGFAPNTDTFKTGQGANFAGVRTFGMNVSHIALDLYVIDQMAAGGTMKPDVDLKAIDQMTSKEQLMPVLKAAFEYAHKATATLTVDNAWDHVGRGPTDTRAEMAAYAVSHTRDHYGQLVEYVRMNGIVPPASAARPAANPSKIN